MKKISNKNYAMSSFLMFRTMADTNIVFRDDIIPSYYIPLNDRYHVRSSTDMEMAIKSVFEKSVDDKTGIMLSGGIDSAILAKYMPKGAKAYTLKALAPNAIDETQFAKQYAQICGLDHNIVEITWDDYEKYSELLMNHKKAPIHSIEVQIYKAALQAKRDGITKLVYGESADAIFGGLDGLLSQDRTIEDMIQRYSYVNPEVVLKDGEIIKAPYEKHSKDDTYVDVHEFISEFFFAESVASYTNACSLAGIDFIAPYTEMTLVDGLDLDRIKNGESKYLVRELFQQLYPTLEVRKKIPMPRPMGEWLKDWEGPTRSEFLDLNINEFKPDQKWLIYSLEKFLDLFDL